MANLFNSVKETIKERFFYEDSLLSKILFVTIVMMIVFSFMFMAAVVITVIVSIFIPMTGNSALFFMLGISLIGTIGFAFLWREAQRI